MFGLEEMKSIKHIRGKFRIKYYFLTKKLKCFKFCKPETPEAKV